MVWMYRGPGHVSWLNVPGNNSCNISFFIAFSGIFRLPCTVQSDANFVVVHCMYWIPSRWDVDRLLAMDLSVYREHMKGSLTRYGMHPPSIRREYGYL